MGKDSQSGVRILKHISIKDFGLDEKGTWKIIDGKKIYYDDFPKIIEKIICDELTSHCKVADDQISNISISILSGHHSIRNIRNFIEIKSVLKKPESEITNNKKIDGALNKLSSLLENHEDESVDTALISLREYVEDLVIDIPLSKRDEESQFVFNNGRMLVDHGCSERGAAKIMARIITWLDLFNSKEKDFTKLANAYRTKIALK